MVRTKAKRILIVCGIIIFVAILITLFVYLFGGYHRTIEDAKAASGFTSPEVYSVHVEKIDDHYVEFIINERNDELSVLQIECKRTMLGERYEIVQTETVSINQKIAFYDQEQAAAWNQLLPAHGEESNLNMVWCIVRPEYRILEDSMVKVRFTYNGKPYVLCCKSSNVSSEVPVTEESIFEMRDVKQEVFYDYPESGYNIPYCLILPKDYDPRQEYPVLLFLHGAGEMGNDNTSHMFLADTMYETAGDWLDYAIFIAPQCPTDSWWNVNRDSDADEKGTLGAVRRLLMYINGIYSCDDSRFYVMGYSMGGYGTWGMTAYYNDLFAAAVPICGWWWPEEAEVFKDIPIWIYHGTQDETVSFTSSQSMYSAIYASGGRNVQFSALEGVGHNAWDYAAVDREMFEWMFSQRR